MKRRTIVQAVIATAALAGSAYAGLRPRVREVAQPPEKNPPKPQIAADTQLYMHKLRERLPTLRLTDAVLLAFIKDHGAAGGSFELDDDQAPTKMARKLVMSTDFFQRDAREDRELSYVRYYDPYVSPCYNPLAAET